MNIQILVHSMTGNSLHVANMLKLNLESEDHHVGLTHIKADDEKNLDPDQIKITALPDIKNADLIIIGGPVRGFAPSTAIKKLLKSFGSLKGKKVVLYVTEFFPFNFMGGKQALTAMANAIEKRGGKVEIKRVIHWYNWGRNLKILKFVHAVKTNVVQATPSKK
ncbi:MAG TPA: flavodoxin [Clostridiales bacterium UBA8960]|nr:flavodoxin [Clostridiales bacterium UBA8960]